MERRHISEAEVARVFAAPEQIEHIRERRVVCQSRLRFGRPAKTYLLRVFVDTDCDPPKIVTAYRTSKIAKYWRPEP